MDDLFKKFINTGVGFLSQGNKAMQSAIEKLVKESKISEQEGKKIVDDLLKNSEAKRTDLEKQLKDLTDDLKNRVGLNAEPEKKTTSSKSKSTSKSAKSAAKKPATSATATAAGTVKKAADKVSATAAKTQRSAAAKAGAAKMAAAVPASNNGKADE